MRRRPGGGRCRGPAGPAGPPGNGAVERLALDELHREEVDALGFFNREGHDDARMIEGGRDADVGERASDQQASLIVGGPQVARGVLR